MSPVSSVSSVSLPYRLRLLRCVLCCRGSVSCVGQAGMREGGHARLRCPSRQWRRRPCETGAAGEEPARADRVRTGPAQFVVFHFQMCGCGVIIHRQGVDASRLCLMAPPVDLLTSLPLPPLEALRVFQPLRSGFLVRKLFESEYRKKWLKGRFLFVIGSTSAVEVPTQAILR